MRHNSTMSVFTGKVWESDDTLITWQPRGHWGASSPPISAAWSSAEASLALVPLDEVKKRSADKPGISPIFNRTKQWQNNEILM